MCITGVRVYIGGFLRYLFFYLQRHDLNVKLPCLWYTVYYTVRKSPRRNV